MGVRLDYKESWAPKNWYFWTVVLKKTLESPLDCKEIQPVNPKGNQSWIFIGRTDAEAETTMLWPPDEKNWVIMVLWKELYSICHLGYLIFCRPFGLFNHLIFFLYIFKNFNWGLITLQYCGGFYHIFTWISHGCTCVPHPEPPSHLPPHPIPQGHPSAPALSTLSHVSYLDLQSISHMIIHMFQCYSLKLSHPHLLPQSPKVCSLHLCLFCYLACRVIVTIFLNSIYMR